MLNTETKNWKIKNKKSEDTLKCPILISQHYSINLVILCIDFIDSVGSDSAVVCLCQQSAKLSQRALHFWSLCLRNQSVIYLITTSTSLPRLPLVIEIWTTWQISKTQIHYQFTTMYSLRKKAIFFPPSQPVSIAPPESLHKQISLS